MADEHADREPEEAAEKDTAPPEEEQKPQQEEPVELQPETPGPPGLDIGTYLSDAWNVVIGNPVLLILGFLVVWALVALATMTFIGGLIVNGPLMFGYLRVLDRRMRGEPAEFADLFGGFQDFTRALLTNLLVVGVWFAVLLVLAVPIIVLAFIPCVGILVDVLLIFAATVFVSAALLFMFPIAALSDVGPADALKKSFGFFTANLWPTVLLALVVAVIWSAGGFACNIGLVMTGPIALAVSVAAYRDYYLPNAPEDV